VPTNLTLNGTVKCRGAQIFQKSSGHLTILGVKTMTWRKFVALSPTLISVFITTPISVFITYTSFGVYHLRLFRCLSPTPISVFITYTYFGVYSTSLLIPLNVSRIDITLQPSSKLFRTSLMTNQAKEIHTRRFILCVDSVRMWQKLRSWYRDLTSTAPSGIQAVSRSALQKNLNRFSRNVVFYYFQQCP
jgi:hypothetical protein